MQKRYTKEQMYSLIRQWESRGISQGEFFRKHHIDKSTFGYWRKKYLRESKQKPAKDFIPVKVDQGYWKIKS